MQKKELIRIISNEIPVHYVDVLIVVEKLIKTIKTTMVNGENIYIRGLGSFIIKKRAAKIGRNVKQNTAVAIPEHFVPTFKPAKEFVNEVKKNN